MLNFSAIEAADLLSTVESLYSQAAGCWTGCDWSTGDDFIAEASSPAEARTLLADAKDQRRAGHEAAMVVGPV